MPVNIDPELARITLLLYPAPIKKLEFTFKIFGVALIKLLSQKSTLPGSGDGDKVILLPVKNIPPLKSNDNEQAPLENLSLAAPSPITVAPK